MHLVRGRGRGKVRVAARVGARTFVLALVSGLGLFAEHDKASRRGDN